MPRMFRWAPRLMGKAGSAKLAAPPAAAAFSKLAWLLGPGALAAATVLGFMVVVGGDPRETVPNRGEGMKFRQRFTGKLVIAILALASVVLIAVCGLVFYERFVQTFDVAIAAGKAKSDTFVLMQALKTVMARHNSNIRITVHETGGTDENLRRLERRSDQLAVSEADAEIPIFARTVAVLFEDVFQLLVRSTPPASETSGGRAQRPAAGASRTIAGFESLQGKTIALSKTGGQFKAFLSLAAQYGLKEKDFNFVGGDDASADQIFSRNEADALFRIRPLLNPAIVAHVADDRAAFLPLDNVQWLRARNPLYTLTTIPKGSYSMSPLVPADDVPSVQVHCVLLASKDLDPQVVNAINEVLIKDRLELASALASEFQWARPLLAQTTQPVAGMDAPLHPGAEPDYQTNEGSFVWSHINLIACTCAGFALLILWAFELRRQAVEAKARYAEAYSWKAAKLMEAALAPESTATASIGNDLLELLTAALQDLKAGKLSGEGFQSFQATWKTAMDVATGNDGSGPLWQLASPAASATGGKAKWNLVKYLQPR